MGAIHEFEGEKLIVGVIYHEKEILESDSYACYGF